MSSGGTYTWPCRTVICPLYTTCLVGVFLDGKNFALLMKIGVQTFHIQSVYT